MVTLLLGPFEVRDGPAAVRLGGRKPRALLARLALDANRTVPAERLVEDLWGEDAPVTAPKMVQIHVSQLRKALPPGVQLPADPNALMQAPAALAALPDVIQTVLRTALSESITSVFLLSVPLAAVAFVVALFLPELPLADRPRAAAPVGE